MIDVSQQLSGMTGTPLANMTASPTEKLMNSTKSSKQRYIIKTPEIT